MEQPKIGSTSASPTKSTFQIAALAGKQKVVPKSNTTDTSDAVFVPILIIAFIALQLLLRRLFGRRLNQDGYALRKSASGQYQLEHRVVAEEILGRRLEAWEIVHHINGRRADNRLKNLCVMDHRDHDRYHEWYDWIHRTYGNYPRRETQLRKLREDFNGTLLADL